MLALESHTVLWGQTLIYTAYALAILLLMGWFAISVTKGKEGRPVPAKLFYSFIAVLVAGGVSVHLITYNTIPWAESELHRDRFDIAQTYDIEVADHAFTLPSNPMQVPCKQMVKFAVTTHDLTYGFGVFRPDHSMVLQMQVVPGHPNEIIWEFQSDGLYTIRSTEYSGPKGANMTIKDAIQVTGCDGGSAITNEETSR